MRSTVVSLFAAARWPLGFFVTLLGMIAAHAQVAPNPDAPKTPLAGQVAPAAPATEASVAAPRTVGSAVSNAPEKPFELLDGDRVVFLGDTLIEREQAYGYVEFRLTARYPDRKILFRNLGWSADTVLGRSRVSFDWHKPEEEWFKHLKAQIAAIKPTVAFLGYGMASSFDGPAGIPKFKSDLKKLIDAIQKIAGDQPVRFVLLSPIRHENLGPPLPDPAEHNQHLARYTEAVREVAKEKKCYFVPVFEILEDGAKSDPPYPLTDNGIHLNVAGYWRLAEAIEIGLKLPPTNWRFGITAQGAVRRGSDGLRVDHFDRREDYVRFEGIAENLEVPPIPGDDSLLPRRTPPNLLQFAGLKAGLYALKIDGQPVLVASNEEWQRGQQIRSGGPSYAQAEQLRQTILKKNELYFHRWRPQNQTYLFGFRKYEQGQNAREIPMFDPLVSEQEAKIAELKKPLKRTFEIAPIQPGETVPKATAPPSAPAAAKPAAAAPTQEAQKHPTRNDSAEMASRSRPTFQVAEGFQIELFAEDPQLAKPIQINFDPKGRLWVASSSVYPQIEPGQVANDKILVLEDTNHDGKADRSTVFADGLLIPTGVEPGDGGAYVGQSTELLHLKDIDGDGRADQKRIVLSGFGTEDTHHILHTLRWGPDGQLYFNQSIYIHSHIETPHGVVRLNSGGIFHFRPPTMQLGIFLKGFINPWGHDFDAFGQSFVTDGAGGNGINYGLPGAMYVTYAGARRILGSVSPGSYPKFCGLEVVRSEHFPDDWQGNMITCDFRAHRVVRFGISEQGSAYVTQEMPDLIRSRDVTFRPIDVKLGPDGALYIADWANPIIQHGEVDFRDPRRDRERGRIWRVTAQGRPLAPRPELVSASNAALLDQLLSPNAFNRQKARRVLIERGKSVLPDLAAWTQKQSSESALLEALWMCQALDEIEPAIAGRYASGVVIAPPSPLVASTETALLEKIISAKDGRIRAAGARVISYWHKRVPIELWARLVADDHPRVRLEAVRALSRIPTVQAADLVLSVLDKPMDPFLDYAAWLSINDLAEPWANAVLAGQWKIAGREKQLQFALNAIEPKIAAPILSQLLRSNPIPADGSGPWIELVGRVGSEHDVRQLLSRAANGDFGREGDVLVRVLRAVEHAMRTRQIKTPSGDLGSLFASIKGTRDESARVAAIRLAGALKESAYAPLLLDDAEGTATPAPVRAVAFDALREIGGSSVIHRLKALAGKDRPLTVRRGAAQTLASLDFEDALPAVKSVLADLDNESDALAFWRSIFGNKGGTKLMTRALADMTLPPVAAQAGLRVAREGGRNEPELILALARSGKLEDSARQLTPAEIQQMVASVRQNGDPARGETVYRRPDLGCVTCHSIGGVGGKVGPDLTSIGASAPVDYLIESLLYPNRKVKEGYHSIVIETKDGQEFSGILVRETSDQLFVRDAADKEIAVPKSNLEKRSIGGSMMPSGLLDPLKEQEALDLYRFLAELGKPGAYDASKGNVARFWKLFPATIDTVQFGDERVVNKGLEDSSWSPAFALVDGRLPRDEFQAKLQPLAHRDPSVIYAAAQFQLAESGPVQLKIEGVSQVNVWIDGKPAAGRSEITTDLAAGKHTLIVKLNARDLPDFLRVQLDRGTFLTQ